MRTFFLCLAVGLLLGGLDMAARAWAATCSQIDHVYNSSATCCVTNCNYDDTLSVKYRDNSGDDSLLCVTIDTNASSNVDSWDGITPTSDCGTASGAPDGNTTGVLTIVVIRDTCAAAYYTTVASFAGTSDCSPTGSSAHLFEMTQSCCP